MALGSRPDDAVHPSLVIVVVDRDRREEASLAGPCPPSSHQNACGQCQPPLSVCGYTLEDLVQYFWREDCGCILVGGIGSLGRPFIKFRVKKEEQTAAYPASQVCWSRKDTSRSKTVTVVVAGAQMETALPSLKCSVKRDPDVCTRQPSTTYCVRHKGGQLASPFWHGLTIGQTSRNPHFSPG